MKRKINDFLDKLNYIIIVILTILVPITFLFNYFNLYHFNLDFTFKIHQYLIYILPIEIFIYIYKLFTKEFKVGICDILIYLLIIFGIISCINAKDINYALYGSIFRHEGLFQIICYYFLFLNSRFINSKEKIIKIINWFIRIGLLQFIYSLLQVFVRGEYIYVKTDIVSYRPSGFIGHPNMLGSYIVLVLLLSLGMYFLHDKNKRFYLISSICLYINLILTQSSGPFYSFVLVFIFMIIFLRKKGDGIGLKKILISLGIGLFLLIGVTYSSQFWCEYKFRDKFTDSFTIIGDAKITINTIGDIVTSSNKVSDEGISFKDEYGSNRIWVWKKSIELVPKYWVTGTGIDNFGYAFLEVDDRNIGYFDRAHNEYLQILVTEGIFAFIYYISLLVIVFIRGIKSKDIIVWILLFAFVGYAIQAFTNISVYNVAPFFFIVVGFMEGLILKEKRSN